MHSLICSRISFGYSTTFRTISLNIFCPISFVIFKWVNERHFNHSFSQEQFVTHPYMACICNQQVNPLRSILPLVIESIIEIGFSLDLVTKPMIIWTVVKETLLKSPRTHTRLHLHLFLPARCVLTLVQPNASARVSVFLLSPLQPHSPKCPGFAHAQRPYVPLSFNPNSPHPVSLLALSPTNSYISFRASNLWLLSWEVSPALSSLPSLESFFPSHQCFNSYTCTDLIT